MRGRIAWSILFVLIAAGCVSSSNDSGTPSARGPTQPLPFPDPMGQDHDHRDIALHVNAYNFEQTDHHPLAGSPTHAAGAHALDLKGGYLFAAVYGGEADAEGGFFIFDASDPEHPKEVGRYRFAGPMGGDRSMEATEDADFVVLGTEVVDCAGHVNPFGPGLYLVDTRDKANPTPVDYVPSTGAHSVTIHRIGDVDYVFVGATAGENVFRIDRGLKPTLTAINTIPIGHDAVVMDDPILGIPILYASNVGAGFEISDVSDPAAPKILGAWNIPDRGDRYYIHTGTAQIIDGHRIVVVNSEDWEDYPSALWVLDATDFEYIDTLSSWVNPGQHAADGLRYSLHNPRFLGDTLVFTHYHGGVWALDLSTPEKWANPTVVGQYMTTQDIGWKGGTPATSASSDRLCGVFHLGDQPLAFDIEEGDGVVYVGDLATGLYTLKPTW